MSGPEIKPSPLGVIPRWAWTELRVRELVDGIARYAEAVRTNSVPAADGFAYMAVWAKELAEHTDYLRGRAVGERYDV